MLRSRDDRRRRALAEEGAREELDPVELSGRDAEPALYAAKAGDLADLRLRDLIPRHRRYLFAWAALLALANGLILVGHYYHDKLCAPLGTEGVAALDLRQPANLATWLIAVTTAGGACCAGLIYAWRRLRLDDYRGRYRWWLAAAVYLAVMSVVTVAPLHLLWQHIMLRLTGWSGWDQGAVWWAGPAALGGLAIALRLAIELTRARVALTLLLLGTFLLCGALAAQSGVLRLAAESAAAVSYGCQMLAGSILLLGFLCYARHVLLEIDGVIKPRKRMPGGEAKRGRKSMTRGEKTLLIDDAHSESPTVSAKSSEAAANAAKPVTDKAPVVNSPSSYSGAAIPKPHAFGANTNPHSTGRSPEPAKATSNGGYFSNQIGNRPSGVNAANQPQPAAKPQYDNADADPSSSGTGKMSRAERKKLRKQQRGQYEDDE